MTKGPVNVAASLHFLCAAKDASKWFIFPEVQRSNSAPLKCCGFLDILSAWSGFATFIHGSFLSGMYFIAVAIFLKPLKEHIVVFIFFLQGLPFS